jgi:O-glycosyl hydrolase
VRHLPVRAASVTFLVGLALTTVVRPVALGAREPRDVTVTVDPAVEHQRIDGFGATFGTVANDTVDPLGEDLRHQALEALFGQIHVSTGSLDAALAEATADGTKQNDDGDPRHINWSGFQTGHADAMKRFVLSRPEASAFTDFALSQRINIRWASPWLFHPHHASNASLADEAAEQVLAGLLYWRDTLKVAPKYVLLVNEPTTGNQELGGATVRDLIEIVKRTGARLRENGFSQVRFVVPNEETEEASLATARAILSDKEARPFVGAIGYHAYPYGSAYSSVPRILARADHGDADGDRVAARHDLRDLAARYHVPLWMTEVSHGDVDMRSFDDLRGRAVHIHDELEFADATAYFGMFAMWDRYSEERHFGSATTGWSQEGTLVAIDQREATVTVTGLGYAMGHYARWVAPGSVRLDAKSSDALVLVSAFRDAATGRLVLVAINNAAENRTVSIRWKGTAIAGPVAGEQSTAEGRWQPMPTVPATADGVTVLLPAKSVSSLAVRRGDSRR